MKKIFPIFVIALLSFCVFAEEKPADTIYFYPGKHPLPQAMVDLFDRPNAAAFDMQGNLFDADEGGNRLLRLDSLLNITNRTSGWGVERDLMQEPADIAAGSGLNVYAADFLGGRLIRFDSYLNFIADIKLSELGEDYRSPLSLAVSDWGEVFILDEASGSILKIDASGQLGLAAGFRPIEMNLAQSGKMALDNSGTLYIPIPPEKAVILYDRYGTPKGKKFLSIAPVAVSADGDLVMIAGENRIVCLMRDKKFIVQFLGGKCPEGILDLALKNGRLALITRMPPFIHLYRLSRSPAGIEWNGR